MTDPEGHDLTVHQVDAIAEDVRSLTLKRADGGAFEGIGAGDHVRLVLPSGRERCYSLVNAADVTDHLEIAVQLDPAGRGGSAEMFGMEIGDTLRATDPLNSFALADTTGESVFIAGGIGITPIWSMIQHLEAAGRPWRLHYGARSSARAAFLPQLLELEDAAPGRVRFYSATDGDRLDLASIVAASGDDAEVYCCGPDRIATAFHEVADELGDRAHVEDFTAAEVAEGGFSVELARSGRTLVVQDGQSILDVVLEAGIEQDYSCMTGTCGTCATGVLDGVPDHRDYYMTDEDKERGDSMMICCSGCSVGPLVLDL